MAYVVGVVLALVVCGFATVVGLDRGREFYATLAMVVATYYVLFAVMGGSTRALLEELAGVAVFVTLAVSGFKWMRWLLVVALAGHGLFDSVHAHLIADPGVPLWWPAFCGSFDVVAGAYLAVRLLRSK